MPPTTVSLPTSDLRNQFAGIVNAANLVPLENAVMNVLNNPPNNMGVTAVDAQVETGGTTVKFTFTAPAMLDPTAVKRALR